MAAKKKAESAGKSTRTKRVSVSEPARPAAVTLDDAAAILMQIEQSDRTGFERLKSALTSVLEDDFLKPPPRDFLKEAIEQIDLLFRGDVTDGEDTLIEVSRLLEAASEANDAREGLRNDLPCNVSVTAAAPVEPVAASAGIQLSAMTEARIPDLLPADADRELLGEFVIESQEFVEGAEAALLTLETSPDNPEAVNSIFRAFHTIKGTSGFLGMKRVTELAHRAESLLSRVRDRKIQCTGKYADLTLRSIDMLKALLLSVREALRGNPMVRPPGYDALLQDLENSDEPTVAAATAPTAPAEHHAREPESATNNVAAAVVDREPPVAERQPRSSPESIPPPNAAGATRQRPDAAEAGNDSTLRVRIDRLDRLIDMVGELVIAQSMVSQDRLLLQDSQHELLRKVSHAGKIVRELQDLSMSMRMVPLRATFQKMHRLVRDLSHKSGKSVRIITEDGDTEIDRHMVDIINDLLVHMVRNSMDHGIEPSDVRVANGKEPTGTIRLTAFHAGGSVVVEIRDDGRGLNRDKIIQKAIATGLIASEKGLSDSELYNLIFAPGFSTADKVTDISGRGVGMDVVRKGVESLHGRIDVQTTAGQGSAFSVRLPLTLAITDGMLVKVGTDRYIVPTNSIHLCFRPERDHLSSVAGRGEIVLLRGELMPVFRLHRLFGIRGAIEDPTAGLLVVVGDGEHHCAFLVDELLGQQQFVAKSLGEGIGRVQGVSGGAIMGDGRVGLILDTAEIAALARQNAIDQDDKIGISRTAA